VKVNAVILKGINEGEGKGQVRLARLRLTTAWRGVDEDGRGDRRRSRGCSRIAPHFSNGSF
jgi:hypothetical protein